MTDEKYPRVGIGVMITNEKSEILLGLRDGSHGAGQWCFPGGHLDFGETVFECAKREAKEECGLEIGACEMISVADELEHIETAGKHYLNIGVKAVYQGGEPKLMEPEKCKEWKWFSVTNLPKNLFAGTNWVLSNYLNKSLYRPAR